MKTFGLASLVDLNPTANSEKQTYFPRLIASGHETHFYLIFPDAIETYPHCVVFTPGYSRSNGENIFPLGSSEILKSSTIAWEGFKARCNILPLIQNRY
ncbi:hypothetical protein CEXT_413871 [Caerostris extrusa]|uniref:Uncharacterized protein n=1 Tax=Caerostris extrusa TaxID=172846 RepID=A0AAV4TQ26_CAEEX|nr:hypothetical protein CEXT_413871 [Caerostris extrusa]